MNELMLFNNNEFGEIRGLIINDEPWFVGKDITKTLGYENQNRDIINHVDEEDRIMLDKTQYENGIEFDYKQLGQRGGWIINESGLYSLILSSKLPSAKAFKSWVTHEVLPSIRKTVKSLENTTFQGNIDGLVISKDGIPITTSRVISEVTDKEHFHILRDIREEINKLKEIHNPNLDSELIINDFKETTYLAENGQVYTQYELGEMATMQLMLKYSTEYRAKFIIAFQKMKTAMLNMFKAKVLDDVLPQNNKLRQYIYVIKNPLNETIKIGVAQDVDKRIKQLQTGAGIELELIYKSMICSNAFAIERDVHEYFKEYRTFGEWFKINPEVVINFLEKQDFVLKSEYMKYISIIDVNNVK